MYAGMHYGYGQQVMSYEREAFVLGGSVAMIERSGSGSTNPSNALYLNVHRVAKVCSFPVIMPRLSCLWSNCTRYTGAPASLQHLM